MIVSPMRIQRSGQLTIVAKGKGVSFRRFQSNSNFELIRNPNSLRITLLQVAHGPVQTPLKVFIYWI